MSKTEKQKMLAGELYHPGDPELAADQAANKTWMVRYNGSLALPVSERHALLSERFGHVGTGVVVRPPFFCDYGYNISLGNEVFLNFNCVILDIARSASAIAPKLDLRRRSMPPTTRATLKRAAAASNSDDRSGSAVMSGSAAGPSFCPASRSATAR